MVVLLLVALLQIVPSAPSSISGRLVLLREQEGTSVNISSRLSMNFTSNTSAIASLLIRSSPPRTANHNTTASGLLTPYCRHDLPWSTFREVWKPAACPKEELWICPAIATSPPPGLEAARSMRPLSEVTASSTLRSGRTRVTKSSRWFNTSPRRS